MAADLAVVFFSLQSMLLQLPPERDTADAEDLGGEMCRSDSLKARCLQRFSGSPMTLGRSRRYR